MLRSLPALLLLALPSVALSAETGDLALGVGVALAKDLPDPVSKDYARFGYGPSLQVPLRWQVAPMARLRLTARVDLATGTDRVSWEQQAEGEAVSVYADGHWAMLLGAGLSAGADLQLPLDAPVSPYFGADLGLAWVGTYHSFSGRTQVLLDPEQNDLDSPTNVDPYTSQVTSLGDLHAGIDVPVSHGLALWVETGYSVAFLNARRLKKTPEELKATRDPYGWNAFRLGAGVVFSL